MWATSNVKIFITSHFLALVLPLVAQNSIIRQDIEGPSKDGAYKWALQTEGGIFHEERGTLKHQRSGSSEINSLLVEGQYQYTSPEGKVVRLLYTADENGFHPVGDHLPTPPPIPLAIQRALDYIASVRAKKVASRDDKL